MAASSTFQPNWASSPGETISDILIERGISVAVFAQRINYSEEQATELLEGRAAVTLAIARRLHETLGASVEFWVSRDFNYRRSSSMLAKANETWLRELPLSDMIKFRWLSPAPKPTEEMHDCLKFFDVSSVDAWQQKYSELQDLFAFRTSLSFESRPAAVAAWLRQGEIEASAINCAPWSSNRFQDALAQIRKLTREKDPRRFIPALKKISAAAGVAVAVVRAPNGCRASGATRFISPERAMLLLSFRHLSDDHFWFTFFHEAGHLLLHGQNRLFVEGIGAESEAEREANSFAERTLVPLAMRAAMLSLPLNSRRVIRFAQKLGIAPGIVVGQLQYAGKIRQNQLNSLKRRFVWSEDTY